MVLAHSTLIWLLLFLLPLSGCRDRQNDPLPEYGPKPADSRQVMVVGVHPLHNPQRLHEIYGPLTDYLSRRIPEVRFELEASRSYAEYERKLYGRKFPFALPNPYETLKAQEFGYHVFAKFGDDQEFYGVILVRRDGGIRNAADLKGKTVSFPAPSAIIATMMPLYHLAGLGLDVNSGISRIFTGSQESSMMSVYQKKSAAGATWSVPWKGMQKRNPEVAAALEVKWRTPHLVNCPIMARNDVPEELVRRVGTELATLHEHAEGRAILARIPISRFEPADDRAYRPIKDFLKKYRTIVRDQAMAP